MEEENSYKIQIGNTKFIVCIKQAETAKKTLDEIFRGFCEHEITGKITSEKFSLEENKKSS